MSQLVFVLFFLFLSMFFSSVEMVFISCDRIRLRKLVEDRLPGSEIVREFLDSPKNFLAAMLIGNNVAHMGVVSMVAYFLHHHFQWHGAEWLVTLISAPLLIILGETVPKEYGRHRADQLLYVMAPFAEIFYKIFMPLSKIFILAVQVLLRPFGKYDKKNLFVTKEEFAHLIEEGTKHGTISEEERRLVEVILNFERIHVAEIMTPVAEVTKIELSSQVGDLKMLARESGASFVLVYEEDPSIIAGTIYVFDILFEENLEKPLSTFLRAPLFLRKDTSAERSFLKLQETHQSFALIMDEQREVVGTVSIDDLIAS